MKKVVDKHITDDFYVNAYSKFASKFECAANRIKSKGLRVSSNIDYSMLQTYTKYVHKGLIRVVGPQYLPGYWFLSKDRPFTEVHPFILMLDGKHSRTNSIEFDIEHIFGFKQRTMSSFSEGFLNEPSYIASAWEENYHWSLGAAFHIGRYYLEKYESIKLKYTIPTILKARGLFK